MKKKIERNCKPKDVPFGAVLSPEAASWIATALELRISHRGNDSDEAVETVLEIIRGFAEERAKSILICRRQEIVARELEQKFGGCKNPRERKRIQRIVDGNSVAVGLGCRAGSRQELP